MNKAIFKYVDHTNKQLRLSLRDPQAGWDKPHTDGLYYDPKAKDKTIGFVLDCWVPDTNTGEKIVSTIETAFAFAGYKRVSVTSAGERA